MVNKTKSPLTAEELSGFCMQVALMLNSGLPLYDGVEALAQTYASAENADMYKDLSEGVIETGSLYEALKRDARWPDYLAEMTAIGERTGRLEEVMKGLSALYEREGRIRRAVISAVTYPLVLCGMMLLIILIMLFKVLPVFRRVLSGMGITVGTTGSALIGVGTGVGWAVLVLCAIVVAAVLCTVILLRTKAREKTLNALNRIFPPLRRINRKLSAARISGVLSMMLSGGYPLEDALEMTPNVLEDEEAVKKVRVMREKVTEGTSFADALSESTVFDELHARMIRMGMAAGREDEVMAKVAQIYEEQVEDGISGLVSIIEPTIVALLSIVIGAILLSVMLPMAGIIASVL